RVRHEGSALLVPRIDRLHAELDESRFGLEHGPAHDEEEGVDSLGHEGLREHVRSGHLSHGVLLFAGAPTARAYRLILSNLAAVSPSIALRSAAVKPGALRTWSTDLACHGIGWSVPMTSWLTPTSAARCRSASEVKTSVS